MMSDRIRIGLVLVLLGCGVACEPSPSPQRSEAEQVREKALALGLLPLVEDNEATPAQVRLGQLLFFDKELSGNRDVACATCHHPRFGSSDGLPGSVGTGGAGLGTERRRGTTRQTSPRNAPALWNVSHRSTFLWDLGVKQRTDGSLRAPGVPRIPSQIHTPLALQALLPVLARDEMRGERGDVDAFGRPNELAAIFDSRPDQVWEALMQRLLRIPGYRRAFQEAFPETATEALEFQHAAIALAAFQSAAFFRNDTPWDAFLRGDNQALRADQLRGARVFLEAGQCVRCHGGATLADERAHNLAVPQLGGGKGAFAPLDIGLEGRTGDPKDRFRFRTPSLRQVAVTGPWMHNGAYDDLAAVVDHHLHPRKALDDYLARKTLPGRAQGLLRDAKTRTALLERLSPLLQTSIDLSAQERKDLLAFLDSLTSGSWKAVLDDVPAQVPSGLPVDH